MRVSACVIDLPVAAKTLSVIAVERALMSLEICRALLPPAPAEFSGRCLGNEYEWNTLFQRKLDRRFTRVLHSVRCP